MNITFYVEPRQCGKTGEIIKEFIKNPENSLFVANHRNNVNHLKERSGNILNKNNICTSDEVREYLRGRKIKTIFLDNYLDFTYKQTIYNSIHQTYSIEKLVIYTTANKRYKKSVIDYVRENKYNKSIKEMAEELSENFDNVKDLYYNFLTDKETKVITTGTFGNFLPLEEIEKAVGGLKAILSPEAFQTQILNNWLC